MRTSELPFDTGTMLKGLQVWVECESPTFDAAAVDRMMSIAAYELAVEGAAVDCIPGRLGFGGSVRARFPHKDFGGPGILICGHLDTVHPVGTLDVLPFRRDGNKCYGPGIQDMKGGNYVCVEAIRQLVRAGIETPLPVTILFTPDEEVGTPSTRDLIEWEARRNKYILIPEPALSDGGVVTGRYAVVRYNILTRGRPSHASWALGDGRSAIAAMARKILQIEALTTDSCTFSVGIVNAGQWVNCVPSFCRAEALSTAKRQSDLDRSVEAILALNGEDDGVFCEITQELTRPVWEADEGTLALYEIARQIGREIGFDLSHDSAGGGSDGNFTGSLGIPTLDSIGVRGAGLHTLGEHIEIDSLVERARLIAELLVRLR